VKNNVGVGMSGQPAPMGDAHPAEHDMIAFAELVNIEAETGAHIAQGCEPGGLGERARHGRELRAAPRHGRAALAGDTHSGPRGSAACGGAWAPSISLVGQITARLRSFRLPAGVARKRCQTKRQRQVGSRCRPAELPLIRVLDFGPARSFCPDGAGWSRGPWLRRSERYVSNRAIFVAFQGAPPLAAKLQVPL